MRAGAEPRTTPAEGSGERVVATLIACGTQTPFSALFLSVLGLRRR
jgi:hypothetical protein